MQFQKSWLYLLLGFIIQLFIGLIYAWSILKVPLLEEFHWTATQLALTYSLSICFFAFGGILSGMISDKVNVRARMLVSALLISSGFLISACLDGRSTVPLHIAYGVFVGTGTGIVFNTVISETMKWFPNRKGLCSGVLGIGYGLSSLLFGNISAQLIDNPIVGWRATYALLGVSPGFIVLLGAILMRTPRETMDNAIISCHMENMAIEESRNYSSKEMLHRFSFWKLFIFFTLLASIGSTALSFAKEYSITLGGSEFFSLNLVGVISVCNGLGRISAGILFDHCGMPVTKLSASGIGILSTMLLLLATMQSNLVLGSVGLCLSGFSYGYSGSTLATVVSALYGSKYYASNFSILMTHLVPASTTATLAGLLVASTGSYISIFMILLLFSLVGLIINLNIRKA